MEPKPEIGQGVLGPIFRDEEHWQIDREAYEPAYSQLVNILKSQIAAGRFRTGAQLPSEAQLRKLYHVSPMTVRRAINILQDQGLVTTAQGRGTFVKAPDMSEAAFQLHGLKEYIAQPDRAHVSLLEARVVPAIERVARKLNIEPDQWVVYIRRLLIEQETPISYHREYLIYDPRRPIVEGELEVTSLVGLIRGNGLSMVQSGAVTIEAITLREEEAELLQTPPGSAAFLVEHVFRDFDDRAVSWGWFVWRADHIKFTATVGPQPAAR
jgi:DNA-binding GntR family transcriptional regulator